VKAEILYGFHPVNEALSASRRTFYEIYIAGQKKSRRIEQIALAAGRNNLPVQKVSSAELQAIAGNVSHQGIAARATPYPLVEVGDLVDSALSGEHPAFMVLLDNIVDPHNLGAILRTAVCIGADGVIIPKDRSAFPTPAVSKISSGLDQNAADSIFAADFTGAMGLIVGGEEKGIRPLVKKNCSCLISIPQMKKIGSLNASVAAAIVMYESYRQRRVVENS
jgi:23S rRNA (guanosine2251-2'-O)-methyltransferase